MTSANLLPTITLHSGLEVDIFNLRVEQILIEDIAHALSNWCRWGAHCSEFYSVAQHCVHVVELLSCFTSHQPTLLSGLLHDASEAYIVDIPRPLKLRPEFAFYRTLEREIMALVGTRFGLPPAEPQIVKDADDAMLLIEARDLMPFAQSDDRDARIKQMAPLVFSLRTYRVTPLTPPEAKARFLQMFETLTKEAA
ncbi:MAG: hypothetical protein ACHREM_00185 [Polyangiales bacterium]